MGWKEWSHSRRGGIIGIIILSAIVLLDFIFTCKFGTQIEFCGLFCVFATFPLAFLIYGANFIASFISSFFDNPGFIVFVVIVYFILAFLMYYLIGALIGWVYGKYKSKQSIQIQK